MDSNIETHMGDLVKTRCLDKNISVSRFADMINTSRQNVYHIFKRKDIKPDQLKVICNALDYDFFQYISRGSKSEIKKSRIRLVVEFDACDKHLYSLVEKLCRYLDNLSDFSCVDVKMEGEDISMLN